MTTPIPAVCLNRKCKTVFLATTIVSIAEGISPLFENNRVGPCPQCGGDGLIPSGTYTSMRTHTFFSPRSPADKRFLEKALHLVGRAIEEKMSPKHFQNEAAKESPGLSALWEILPETKTDAYNFYRMIFAALTLLLAAYAVSGQNHPAEIRLPKDVIDAIQSARTGTHVDSHKENSDRPKRPTRRRR